MIILMSIQTESFFAKSIELIDGDIEMIDMKGDGETEVWFEHYTQTRLYVPIETVRYFHLTMLNY